jgi:DNA repair ATPase RecN
MTTLYDISRFCDAFDAQVAVIEHLKPDFIPEKHLEHIQLYKKSLVMSAIDSLSGYRFTKPAYRELNQNPQKRFIRFVAEFSDWKSGPAVSVPYLFELLARRELKTSEIYITLHEKLAKQEGNVDGRILHVEEIDVMAAELFDLAKTEYEEQLILKSQHYSILYDYRNCKTNGLSEAGGMMEAFQYARPNYYSHQQSEYHDLREWQLSYPLAHFNSLFGSCLKNMKQYFIKNNINPYD